MPSRGYPFAPWPGGPEPDRTNRGVPGRCSHLASPDALAPPRMREWAAPRGSEVSQICVGLDQQVAAFRTRPLHHTTFPYVFLDATYLHVRRGSTGGQVTSMAVVVAAGVTASGGREVLGVDVGDSEDEVFWRGFLRSLKAVDWHAQVGMLAVVAVLLGIGLVGFARRDLRG